jgi:hypothetical protein
VTIHKRDDLRAGGRGGSRQAVVDLPEPARCRRSAARVPSGRQGDQPVRVSGPHREIGVRAARLDAWSGCGPPPEERAGLTRGRPVPAARHGQFGSGMRVFARLRSQRGAVTGHLPVERHGGRTPAAAGESASSGWLCWREGGWYGSTCGPPGRQPGYARGRYCRGPASEGSGSRGCWWGAPQASAPGGRLSGGVQAQRGEPRAVVSRTAAAGTAAVGHRGGRARAARWPGSEVVGWGAQPVSRCRAFGRGCQPRGGGAGGPAPRRSSAAIASASSWERAVRRGGRWQPTARRGLRWRERAARRGGEVGGRPSICVGAGRVPRSTRSGPAPGARVTCSQRAPGGTSGERSNCPHDQVMSKLSPPLNPSR